jgi:hypothetical protein
MSAKYRNRPQCLADLHNGLFRWRSLANVSRDRKCPAARSDNGPAGAPQSTARRQFDRTVGAQVQVPATSVAHLAGKLKASFAKKSPNISRVSMSL